MEKLSVFSKKLGEVMEVTFTSNDVLVTPEGMKIHGDGVVFAWNNTSSGWVDKGWNNTSYGWVDKGWNNSGGRWIDGGWNNTSQGWIDKGWCNTSANWSNADGGGSGCYITTVCVEHMGLPDDCKELSVLRKYRDQLVSDDEKFRFKVLEYYRKAPLIVQKILEDENSGAVLDDLYVNMILRCVSLLECGKKEEAKDVYLESYEKLVNRYLSAS